MPPPNKRKSQLNDALGRPKSFSCQTEFEFDKFQELLEVTRAELLATKEMNESLQQQMDELKNARNELQEVRFFWSAKPQLFQTKRYSNELSMKIQELQSLLSEKEIKDTLNSVELDKRRLNEVVYF